MQLEMNFKTTAIGHHKFDMTESVNTSIASSANITKPYNINTGMNINQKSVVETESVTILWDFAIYTDRKIDGNKPNITIKDHKNNSD